MKYIPEPKKKLLVYGKFDVVVAGGGPAGIAAAIAAVRNGAKTILIEQTGCLGGLGTSGLVPSFCPFSNSDELLVKGIGLEVQERLKAKYDKGEYNFVKGLPIDAEKLKLVYDEMIKENRVNILYFTLVSGVIKEKDKIKGIIIENKSGRQVVLGKVFIDATGDADVAFKANVPFEIGGKKGEMQGVSICFTIAGIDNVEYNKFSAKMWKYKRYKDFLKKAEKSGKLSSTKDSEFRIISRHHLYRDFAGFNFGHVFGIDGTNADDLTYAMLRGRQMAHEFIEFAKKTMPGMKNAKLAAVASLVGVRETRRIKGEYRLTIDDYMSARQFKDNITLFAYPIDVHVTNKSPKDNKRFLKEFTTMRLPAGKACGVPFRSLLPVNISNLAVPGRALASDRLVQGSVRVMPYCFSMGEAAGVAAKLAIKQNCSFKKICIEELQNTLIKQGARIY